MYHIEPGMYEMYKADTGAIRFKVRYPMGVGFAVIVLTSKCDPQNDLYQIFFGPTYKFLDLTKPEHDFKTFSISEPVGHDFREFWLTWHSNSICLGVDRQLDPVLTYKDSRITQNNIGFIKFYIKYARNPIEWEFEASPVVLKPPKEIKFESELEWRPLKFEVNANGIETNIPVIPDDAMIGGFENEPIYIARGPLNGSLCVGKYVPSKYNAFYPWGGLEHPRPRCEVLCGFNAKWVKTKGNHIPGNAIIAGLSEVRNEPLYVGRAMHDDCLLVGKVHPLHSLCYLPYKGKEIEVDEYEILVKVDEPRGVLPISNDYKERRPPRQIML